MNFFNVEKEPTFLKENSSAVEQIEKLKELYENVNDEGKTIIDNDIKLLEAGIYGENQIVFELKNSHVPMIVLQDIYLEHNGLSAQIDFMIFTRGFIFVVECKNLVGNITIDNAGNFTRIFDYGKYKKKEGLYSPITQNKRHLELIKQRILDKQTNIIARKLAEKSFEQNFKSVVVLANPKTALSAKFAPKEIKNSVIRADQLVEYIKNANANYALEFSSEKSMLEIANSYLRAHVENAKDYTEKYNEYLINEKPEQHIQNIEEKIICPKCGAEMIKRVAAKGSNAGNVFYGCSKFPKCRGIINIKN
ncbi:MAG: NERD domain-containing protein [Candidatus Gastranaerophilales bacterium]|nr:NERD domain-containing protein [Candidatus Gastranaerophilales bacterium]